MAGAALAWVSEKGRRKLYEAIFTGADDALAYLICNPFFLVGAGDYGMPATFIIGSGLVSTAGFTDVLGAAPWPDRGGATSA